MEDDLELDSEGTASGSATQPVRRHISLKLKPKLKSSSSTKVKKRESKYSERKSTSDAEKESKKKVKSSTLSAASHDPIGAPQVKELDWNHKILIMGQKVQDPLLHLCEKCSLPILVYGRLSPCKHSFCLSCAEKGGGKCPRCGEGVQRIERAPLGSVYVCSFGGSRYGISGCRRSYFSQRDLQSHIKRRHQREQSGGDSDGAEEADSEAKRPPVFVPTASGPFFQAPPREGPGVVPPHPMIPGDRPFGNVPIMDGRHFVPSLPREAYFMEGMRPHPPPVSGFPAQGPPQATHLPPVPQGPFRPEQGPVPRFEGMRTPQGPMVPGPIPVPVSGGPHPPVSGPGGAVIPGPAPIEGFSGPRSGVPAFRFQGPDNEGRPGNWPPRSEGDWIPPDRGPPVRGERDWIPQPGRAERDWGPPRSEGNWGPGNRPPPEDPHFRPMF